MKGRACRRLQTQKRVIIHTSNTHVCVNTVKQCVPLLTDIDPPRDLVAVESSETTISLRWQKPQAKVGAYRLVYVSSDGEVSEDEIPPMQTSYVLTNLTPGMSYRVTLAAERGLKRSTPAAVSASTGGSQYRTPYT